VNEVKNLRIVHICTSVKGGAGTAAYRIHEALLNGQLDSNFLCLDFSNNDKKAFILIPEKKYYSSNIIFRVVRRLRRILSETFNKTTIFIKQYYAIQRLLECEYSSIPNTEFDFLNHQLVKSADIIHLHWVAGLLDYPSFFSKVDKPIVWTFHDMNAFQGIFHYKEDELRNEKIACKIDKEAYNIKIKSIQSCKVPIEIVCPSAWLTSAARASNFCCQLKVNTIPYPIDFNAFQRRNKKLLRENLKIGKDEIVLLFACQNINLLRKGFNLLLKALETISDKDIIIYVIGKKDSFNIANFKIRFTGSMTDNYLLSEYYSLADAFIIPSREDNLPNVMIESFSCGTPVIGFPVGGIKEHVVHQLTGILAKEVSSEALADAIKEFINSRHNFESDKIRDYALNNFENTQISDRYSNIYYSLIDNKFRKLAL
jgi:glycosyltransferase involved in cell wall biosynthesis